MSWASWQSVALPLAYLGELGVARAPTPVVAQGPLELLLADYRRYLLVERRLSEHTVFDAYGPAARLFLAGWEAPDGLGLERLCAADVSSFLARECPKRSEPGRDPRRLRMEDGPSSGEENLRGCHDHGSIRMS